MKMPHATVVSWMDFRRDVGQYPNGYRGSGA